MIRARGNPAWAVASVLERILVGALRLEHRWPPLFIVGAPRSGTTAVYLHLLNRFRFAYFPNLSKRHPHACVTAAALGRRFDRYEPTYEHRYGTVEGAMAPSDGWDILHRWFPRYDHTRPVARRRLYELRNIVRLFELLFDAPFANKNNANSIRVRQLAALFPDAFFVHVRRDAVDTTLSLLEARRTHDVGLNEWWSASPPMFLDRTFSDPVEQAVHQTWGVERFLRESLAELSVARWRSFDYEAVCVRPETLERWVQEQYADADVPIARRADPAPGGLRVRSRRSPTAGEAARIRSILDRLDGEHGVAIAPGAGSHMPEARSSAGEGGRR